MAMAEDRRDMERVKWDALRVNTLLEPPVVSNRTDWVSAIFATYSEAARTKAK